MSLKMSPERTTQNRIPRSTDLTDVTKVANGKSLECSIHSVTAY